MTPALFPGERTGPGAHRTAGKGGATAAAGLERGPFGTVFGLSRDEIMVDIKIIMVPTGFTYSKFVEAKGIRIAGTVEEHITYLFRVFFRQYLFRYQDSTTQFRNGQSVSPTALQAITYNQVS